MQVLLKQSGELLAKSGEAGKLWTPNGVRSSVEKVATAHRNRERLGLTGLLLVSGAGNIIRGNELRHDEIANGMADVLGRLATVQNTIVLAEALRHENVPVKVFIADTMRFVDGTVPTDYLTPFSQDEAQEAYDAERVVLVAGGTGEDGATTDNAVLEYARRHHEANPDQETRILKGTKHDGVYDRDPARHMRAVRFSSISAGHMLANYKQFSVVDEACLEQIQRSGENGGGLSLQVYADGKHDLMTVLSDSEAVGTTIVPGDSEPVVATRG